MTVCRSSFFIWTGFQYFVDLLDFKIVFFINSLFLDENTEGGKVV